MDNIAMYLPGLVVALLVGVWKLFSDKRFKKSLQVIHAKFVDCHNREIIRFKEEASRIALHSTEIRMMEEEELRMSEEEIREHLEKTDGGSMRLDLEFRRYIERCYDIGLPIMMDNRRWITLYKFATDGRLEKARDHFGSFEYVQSPFDPELTRALVKKYTGEDIGTEWAMMPPV
jgi:hypothetical protein